MWLARATTSGTLSAASRVGTPALSCRQLSSLLQAQLLAVIGLQDLKAGLLRVSAQVGMDVAAPRHLRPGALAQGPLDAYLEAFRGQLAESEVIVPYLQGNQVTPHVVAGAGVFSALMRVLKANA